MFKIFKQKRLRVDCLLRFVEKVSEVFRTLYNKWCYVLLPNLLDYVTRSPELTPWSYRVWSDSHIKSTKGLLLVFERPPFVSLRSVGLVVWDLPDVSVLWLNQTWKRGFPSKQKRVWLIETWFLFVSLMDNGFLSI